MRAVVQRVSSAEVRVDEKVIGAIGKGLLVLLAVGKGDGEADLSFMSSKIPDLRIFEDPSGKLNLSLKDIRGEMLIVSQFTLYGDCRKGRRPSFVDAEDPSSAKIFYERFISNVTQLGIPVQTGEFQAMMQVHLINDGPVTLILDSRRT